MVQYYVGEFGLDIRVAALLAACFSLPGGVLRAIGGVLSDKYGAHKRHLVGDVAELDLPVPAELPADRHDHADHGQRPAWSFTSA
jgi:nitrate/nitrite transporter NarK